MGSFYMRDAITNSIIKDYDEVVMFLVEENKDGGRHGDVATGSAIYPNHRFNFASLPIHGTYADYGRIEAKPCKAVDLAIQLTGASDFEDVFDKIDSPIVRTVKEMGLVVGKLGVVDGTMGMVDVEKKSYYGKMIISKNTYDCLKGNSRFSQDELKIYTEYMNKYVEQTKKWKALSAPEKQSAENKKMWYEINEASKVLTLYNDTLYDEKTSVITKLPLFFRSLSRSDGSIPLSSTVIELLNKESLLNTKVGNESELVSVLRVLNDMFVFSRALMGDTMLIQPSSYGGQSDDSTAEIKFKFNNIEHVLNKSLTDLFDYADEKDVMKFFNLLVSINTKTAAMIDKVANGAIQNEMESVVDKYTAINEKKTLEGDLSTVKSKKPKVKKA